MSRKSPSEVGTIPELDPELVRRLLRLGLNDRTPRQESRVVVRHGCGTRADPEEMSPTGSCGAVRPDPRYWKSAAVAWSAAGPAPAAPSTVGVASLLVSPKRVSVGEPVRSF